MGTCARLGSTRNTAATTPHARTPRGARRAPDWRIHRARPALDRVSISWHIVWHRVSATATAAHPRRVPPRHRQSAPTPPYVAAPAQRTIKAQGGKPRTHVSCRGVPGTRTPAQPWGQHARENTLSARRGRRNRCPPVHGTLSHISLLVLFACLRPVSGSAQAHRNTHTHTQGIPAIRAASCGCPVRERAVVVREWSPARAPRDARRPSPA